MPQWTKKKLLSISHLENEIIYLLKLLQIGSSMRKYLIMCCKASSRLSSGTSWIENLTGLVEPSPSFSVPSTIFQIFTGPSGRYQAGRVLTLIFTVKKKNSTTILFQCGISAQQEMRSQLLINFSRQIEYYVEFVIFCEYWFDIYQSSLIKARS